MNWFWIIILVFLVILILKKSLYIIKDWERAIIFRLGKLNRVAGPGIFFIIPFIERVYRIVDLRIRQTKIEIDNVYTKDNSSLRIKATIYWRIKDPAKYIYLKDPDTAIKNLFLSELRDTIGSLYLDEVFSNIDKINDYILERLRYFTWKWGIQIDTVQLTKVEPTERIARALEEVKVAEQRLLAQRYLAEARRILLRAIGDAANKLNDRAIMYLYLQALKEVGKAESSKLILPMQFFGISEKDENIEREIVNQLRGINLSQLIQTVKKVMEEESKK